jgi:hypothetical protein
MKIPIHARQPLPVSARNMSIELSEILGYLASEGSDYDRIDDHLGFDNRKKKNAPKNNTPARNPGSARQGDDPSRLRAHSGRWLHFGPLEVISQASPRGLAAAAF